MSNLYETIRQIVQQELRQHRGAELAVVQEQHPHGDEGDKDNYSCTVVLRDSEIVLKRVPVAIHRKGLAAIPDVGDLVLLQFLGGDVNGPIIVGSLYNDEDRPPVNLPGQYVMQLPLGGGEDETIALTVSTEEEKSIVLKLGNALELTLIDDDPVLKLDVDGGKALLEVARDGSLILESAGNVDIKGSADINIEASGNLNLKGATVNLN